MRGVEKIVELISFPISELHIGPAALPTRGPGGRGLLGLTVAPPRLRRGAPSGPGSSSRQLHSSGFITCTRDPSLSRPFLFVENFTCCHYSLYGKLKSRGGCLFTTSELPSARWSGEGVGFPMGNRFRGSETKQGVGVGREEPMSPAADMPTRPRVSFFHDAGHPTHETQKFFEFARNSKHAYHKWKSKVVHR